MSVSARVHYASQALVELAIRRDDPAPVTIRDITDRHGVPGPFLTQILRTLRSAGWVQSIRGREGGYRLAVDPDSITLLDIAKLVGCSESTPGCCDSPIASGEALSDVWSDAGSAFEEILASHTLSSIADRVQEQQPAMYFI